MSYDEDEPILKTIAVIFLKVIVGMAVLVGLICGFEAIKPYLGSGGNEECYSSDPRAC